MRWGRMRKDWTDPEIESGFPLPDPIEVKADRRRVLRPSPWVAFLQRIQPGENSFLTPYYTLAAVKNAADKQQMTIIHEAARNEHGRPLKDKETGMAMARVWRTT